MLLKLTSTCLVREQWLEMIQGGPSKWGWGREKLGCQEGIKMLKRLWNMHCKLY